ncbi:TPA: DUF1616 domain-containing protein [Candidatus Woesearchaeota archaeon]|nr:DUF1616 domain-containing protein [Candidatus Woesearchaeota archaeon]HIH32094.1 DUF1616 domain-containing protein [Candidatus Woesearchaeota archaeon]HIH54916.1 DUF1616 domain-containing protein [Candidatus Woesearchaeota archaeon]HIJ01793.1 DUF1616 domain-containing protein [Candidatus Woesearchaeota archaeon]HIJ14034.1 DUF1616 domain-containing protein [Candidatus Woesearchaeota archaeon]
MEILQILQIIIGLPLALFLPGYLITRIFFKELEELEKIALGFVVSIAVDIFLGLFLGYNKYMKELTGGITALNLWIYLGSITILLLIFWALIRRNERKAVMHAIKSLFVKNK